ncbi:putative disease resistance RPP13-like protein 3 [Ziziphus jujuba]|uniref:Disease resistance RPP13-like protein 3 n=1 Tax=Ziziphus jujuba TaxID=326968 RepID=A0ABM3I4Z3_ZIZJJ|nr:putative disease resistance RPP13-like protein 3 [Ziziphus jujuba]
MSDIVVSFVLENLKNLLIYEANLFLGVKEQVDLLKDDLGFMISFLKDSEGKQNEDYTAKEVISQIRDATFEAEDVISMYMAQVIKQRRRNLLQKLFHSFGHATMLHDVASETTRIKNKIDNIYANKSRFGIEAGSLSHLGEDEERLPVQCRRDVEEVDMVGFDNDTTTLVHQLTDGSLQLEVTSIIGMGGVGKTTLARKIYNNSRIKNHFDCCAWVIVSQQYKTHRLLLDMMKCFMSLSDEIFKKSDKELKHKLRDNLKGRRYFVVMDNVWKPEVWDEIKAAFPDESNGSRLLITSREKAVATHASPTPYFLPFLDEEASWELFCKKVFRGEKCPSYLESLGRQLAESCKGLPLSIVVLGGILANKDKTHQIWSSFVGNESRFLFEDRNTCFDILALSYNQLPRKLKLCFLYVGVFPEDFEIPVRHLTHLWIAEGFIPVRNGINRKLEEDMGIAE